MTPSVEGRRQSLGTEQLWENCCTCARNEQMSCTKETARKITCPTESDEMNLKRMATYLKGAPSARAWLKSRQRIGQGQATTCKSTSGGVVQWGNETLTAWPRTQQNSKFEFFWSRIIRLDNWSCWRNGDETSLARTGSWSDSHEPCRQSAKGWASMRGLGWMKHVMLKHMCVKDVVDKKLRTLAFISAKENKADLMTKCHTSEAHKRGCAMIGLRLAWYWTKKWRYNVRKVNEQQWRRNENTDKKCEIKSKCPDLKEECGE